MNHPACHLADVAVVFLTLISAAISPIIIAAAPNSEVMLLLLPMLGAMLASGAGLLLNPEPETRRIVIGRSIIALVFGVAGPQIIGELWPKFDATTIRPVFLVIGGFLTAGLAYLLSRPIFAQGYARAKAIAKIAADAVERRAGIDSGKDGDK
jgi:hypothetical protein